MIAKLIQVIETFERRGGGHSPADPVRNVRQYWSVDGVLLAECDPCSEPRQNVNENATSSPAGDSPATVGWGDTREKAD